MRHIIVAVAVIMMAVIVEIRPTIACPDDPEARSAYPSWRCR
jgi:hypothetical protein